MRSPGPGIGFQVGVWVPEDALTADEKVVHDAQKKRKQEEEEAAKARVLTLQKEAEAMAAKEKEKQQEEEKEKEKALLVASTEMEVEPENDASVDPTKPATVLKDDSVAKSSSSTMDTDEKAKAVASEEQDRAVGKDEATAEPKKPTEVVEKPSEGANGIDAPSGSVQESITATAESVPMQVDGKKDENEATTPKTDVVEPTVPETSNPVVDKPAETQAAEPTSNQTEGVPVTTVSAPA